MNKTVIPKISVCVITYNHCLYIRDCLDSIVTQNTTFDFEVIVGDDGSTDATTQIVQEYVDRYPNRVIHVLHQPKVGGTRNFLDCHNRARGDFVAHMDGDDRMLPGKLQAQADALESDPSCTAVWHRVDFFDDAGGFCSGKEADLSPFVDGIVSFDSAIRLGFVGVHSSLMYRRSARGPEPQRGDVLDLFRTWDVLSSGYGRILDQVLGRYRVGASGSLTVSSQLRIRRLSIDHARYFLTKFPERRQSFFVFALSNAIVDSKNRRRTAFDFFYFALETLSFVSLRTIMGNLRDIRRIQVPWKRRRQVVS